jgi:hypothetical protein
MTTELEFPFGSPTLGEAIGANERKAYRSFIYRVVGWSETNTEEFTTITPMSAKQSWRLVPQQHRSAVVSLSNNLITRWNDRLYSTFRMAGPATVCIDVRPPPEDSRIALRTNDATACRIMFKLQNFFDLKRRLRE